MLNGKILITSSELTSNTRMSTITSSVQQCTGDPSQCTKAIANNKIYKDREERTTLSLLSDNIITYKIEKNV